MSLHIPAIILQVMILLFWIKNIMGFNDVLKAEYHDMFGNSWNVSGSWLTVYSLTFSIWLKIKSTGWKSTGTKAHKKSHRSKAIPKNECETLYPGKHGIFYLLFNWLIINF